MNAPQDLEPKPCRLTPGCKGTMVFNSKSAFPGMGDTAGFVDDETGRGPRPQGRAAPGWFCETCNRYVTEESK
jgi:hypothetical protein